MPAAADDLGTRDEIAGRRACEELEREQRGAWRELAQDGGAVAEQLREHVLVGVDAAGDRGVDVRERAPQARRCGDDQDRERVARQVVLAAQLGVRSDRVPPGERAGCGGAAGVERVDQAEGGATAGGAAQVGDPAAEIGVVDVEHRARQRRRAGVEDKDIAAGLSILHDQTHAGGGQTCSTFGGRRVP